MTTIYHNPRCRKSREALALLEEKNEDFTIIKYLDTPLNREQLEEIISLLGISPIDLVRKNEATWKENYKTKSLSDDEVIRAMLEHPKLIERPIIVKENKAVIGRPAQKIVDIL